MSTVIGTFNTVTGDRVTVTNAINPATNAPSTNGNSVSYTTTPGVVVARSTLSPDANVILADGNDFLLGQNMIWGNSDNAPSFDAIDMGAGNDTVVLERSYVEDVTMGAGNDSLNLNNSSGDDVNMGTGNDTTSLTSDPANQPSDAELAQKLIGGAPRLDLDGGSGSDTLNLQGAWTVTLSSGNVSIDVNGDGVFTQGVDRVTNVFSNGDVPNILGYPSVLNGTVRFPDITLTDGRIVTNVANFSNYEAINAVCFTAGTMIDTPHGAVAIETLREGDMVSTRNGPQKLMWIGKRRLDVVDLMGNPKLLPVHVPAGAFGNGLPTRDVRFSPQHRVVIRSAIAQKMFGAPEVLVSVKQLIGTNGIEIDAEARQVIYFHLMFEQHQILSVEGIEAESLYPGKQAISFLSQDQLRELHEIFPDLNALIEADSPAVSALPFLKGRESRSLAARHVKNNRPLYS